MKGTDGSGGGGGGANRSITGMSQGSYPIAPAYPERAGSSRVPGGDILDQEIGSQIGGPQQTGAISGRSSNARRSFDALDQFGGMGGASQQAGGFSPSRKMYNNTVKQFQGSGGSADHSNLLAPPQQGGALAQLFSPQMDKAFSAGG